MSVSTSKTAVTNTYHWSNQENLDCLWIQLKRILIKGPIPHRTRLNHIPFGWHYVGEEWWASQCCLFHALQRYLYSLSFYMITFALFDRLIILPVVVSIEFYKQKYIICIKKWKLARVLRDSSDSFDAAVKSKFLVCQTATKPKSTDHARRTFAAPSTKE